MASKERVTDLVVRAHDQYSKVLNNLKKMQADVAATSAAAARRSVVEQKAAQAQTAQSLQKTQDEIRKLANEFKALSSTQGASRAEIAALVVAKMKLQVRANELKNALLAMKVATHGVTAAQKGGFAAFIRNTEGIRAQGVAADVTAAKLKKLAAAQTAAAAAPVQRWTDSGVPSRRGRGDSAGRKGESQDVELYGLKPYQMVNLGYQVNDVISGLAMGQRPIQILAQQVGQFVQIWPQMMVGLIRGLPVIAGLAAAFLPLIAAIVRVNNEAATLDEFNGRLAAMADGGRYTAEGLAAITSEFEKLQPFLKGGFDQGKIAELFKLSEAISKKTGEKFEDVSQNVATAFAGNAGTIRDLDKELQFLTAAQLRNIRAMEDSGNAAGALDLAQQLLEARFASSATQAGVWGQAIGNLGQAWNDLIDWLADTKAFSVAVGALDLLGKSLIGVTAILEDSLTGLKAAIDDLSGTDLSNAIAEEAALAAEITFLKANPNGMAAYGTDLPALEKELDLLRERIRLLQLPNTNPSSLPTLSASQMAAGGTIATEEELKLQDDFLRSVRETSITRYEEIAALSKSGLQLELYNNLLAMHKKAKEKGRIVTSAMTKSVVASTVALYNAKWAQDRLKKAEENAASQVSEHTSEYEKQRKEIVELTDDVQRLTVAHGATSPEVVAAQKALDIMKAKFVLALDTSGITKTQIDLLIDEAATAQLSNRERFIEAELLKARNAAFEKAKALGLDFLKVTEEQNRLLREQAGITFDRSDAAGFGASFAGATDAIEAATQMIAKFEGFRSEPYPDVNANRIGFGSDTITTATGEVKKVIEGMVVSIEDASRDLYRRITEEFGPNTKAQVGAARFEQFAPAQQAALISIAYNYGSLPERILAAVRTGTNAEISAAISGLGGDNSGKNRGRREKEANVFGADSVAALGEKALEVEADRLQTSKEYLESYRERIKTHEFELSLASQAAREAAISKAIYEEELTAKKAGLELTKEQRAEIERTTGALFDRENVELRVNELMEQRSLLLESLELAQSAGDSGKVATIVTEIQGTEKALNLAIDDAIAFWQAIGGPGADAAILNLQNIRGAVGDVVKDFATRLLPTAEDINDTLSDIGGDAFTSLAEAIANGTNIAQAFFQTLLQGIGDFLIEIGKAIIKQALFNAISKGTAGGGAGGFLSKIIGSIFHSGGIIGSGTATRTVNPAVFAGAQRFHGGGILGLKPGEVPMIGMKNEEVLTADDPRHIMNGGGGKSANLKVVNVLDPVELLEAALASESGESVLMNFMSRRSRRINGLLTG